MKKIILDTNMLMAVYQFNVDIFSEIDRIINEKYELCVLDNTIKELKNIIKKQKGKNKRAAEFSLNLVKLKKIKILKTKNDKEVDNVIIDLSKKPNIIIATNDKELKKRFKYKRLIVLRQKSHLVLT